MSFSPKLRALFAHPTARYWTVGIALLLTLPAVGTGFLLDDHLHRSMLQIGEAMPEMVRGGHQLYEFIPDDPAWHRTMREYGTLPWYTSPETHVSFLRPVSSLLLYLDQILAPDSAVWSHLHSLLWLAALVLVVGAIYRQLFQAPWVSGLAMVLFAVDDAHAMPAAWIANRNAVIAMVFGALALLCHVHWRRQGSRLAAWLAPIFLAIGLLSSEVALSITGYLFAFALFIDKQTNPDQDQTNQVALPRRLATLLPYLPVVGAWALCYVAMGYGTRASSLYLSPIEHPLALLKAAGPRLMVLLQGQFTPVPAEVLTFVPDSFSGPFVVAACLSLGVIMVICFGLLRASGLARFFLSGLTLSTLALCTTVSHDRLLLAVGIGGSGLVAQLLAGQAGSPHSPHQSYWERGSVRALALFWIATHLLLSPILLPAKAYSASFFSRVFNNSARSLDRVGELEGRTLVFVNGPNFFLTSWTPLLRTRLGLSRPKRVRVLGTTPGAVQVTRIDGHTLRLRAPHGFFASPFDALLRHPDRPFSVGSSYRLSDLRIVVTKVTPDGSPAELICRFRRSLEDPSLVWTAWHSDGYRPLVLPAVGETTTLAPMQNKDLFALGLDAGDNSRKQGAKTAPLSPASRTAP
jgi:hypothetical protein